MAASPLLTVGTHHETAAGWRLLPVMLLAFAGVFSQGLAPFIVHGLRDYAGLSASQAGLCVGAEMGGSTLGIVGVLFVLGAMSRQRVAVLALVGVMLGNCLCLAASAPLGYLGARFIAGIGCGLTTSAFGIMATVGRPARNFAIFSGASVVLMSAADACIPALLAHGGLAGLFLLIAAPAIVALPFVGWLPGNRPAVARAAAAFPTGPARRAALIGLLTNACFFTSLAAFWTYVTEIAVANGNDPRRVADVLATGFLMGGIGGSALAALLARQLRPAMMIGIGTPIMAAAVSVIVWVPGFAPFAGAAVVYLLLWFVTYPFLMALVAGLDAAGSLTVMAVLTQSLGWLAGPALGSVLIARGPNQLGVLCCAGFLLAMICAYLSRSSLVSRQAS